MFGSRSIAHALVAKFAMFPTTRYALHLIHTNPRADGLQEVFADGDTDQSIIIEIVEHQDVSNENAAR